MNLTKQICHKAAHFDAVAFDVFDTLIKRDVAVPTGLFRLMGDDFYAARIRAEREARAAQSREITLAEIYARPCLARYDAAAECAAELAACAANKPVLDAVQTLKKQGKKLYYISDMYLPQTQIDAMLRRCGYPCFDGGFVSCTYGVQKRSGRLFKRFLQETGLTAKQLLFIGDSWRADVAGAALAGIVAWHLPTPPAPADDAAAFVENRLPQQQSDGESLGFSVLGLLAVAFCQWLHARRAARPEARLYFLARDMYLMRDVYHTLYPQEETGYLQVSRRSLAPAFLAAGDWVTVLAALPRQTLTGAQIAEYCGTTCPPELPLHGLQLSADDRLRTRFAPDQTEVFLFDGKPAPRLYWAGQPMLERLLSQDVGATLGYCAEKGGIVRVRTSRQPAEPRIAQIQSGVRCFAAAWWDSVLNGQPIPPQRAIAPFLRLVESPTALQLELLGDLTVEDGGTYPLAAPQHTAHYLTHPRQARRDFAEARWKIGFLQRAVPLPLPYGKIYLKLKK